MTNTLQVGFAGLGHMGQGMAARLLAAGFPLTVYNRSRDKAQGLAGQGAQLADTPAGLGHCPVVVSMVFDDAALRDITLGEHGLLSTMPPGSVHVSCSTVSPDVTRELAAAHAERGVGFVAAPVFGRPDVAARGELNSVVAGEGPAVQTARPVIEAYSRAIFEVGDRPEVANVVKLAGNFLLHTVVESLGEAIALSEHWGLSGDTFMNVMTSTLFSAPVYKLYGQLIVNRQFDPAFPVKAAQKDLRLALAAADAQGLTLPIGNTLKRTFETALDRGLGEKDLSALSEVVRGH